MRAGGVGSKRVLGGRAGGVGEGGGGLGGGGVRGRMGI